MSHSSDQKYFTVWLTGLSGTGKSTVASALEKQLSAIGRNVAVLDGDALRLRLNSDLGFSKADRDTNVRRIGWLCELLNDHSVDVVVATISPYRNVRNEVREGIPHFVEVLMDCSIETLVRRDPKGLYRKALAGEIKGFTGVSDPYEPPVNPDVVCRTDGLETPDANADRIIYHLLASGLIGPESNPVHTAAQYDCRRENRPRFPGSTSIARPSRK